MKVLLIGNYENLRQQSMQRFAEMLRQGLADAGHDVKLVRPPVWLGQLWRSEVGIGKWLGYVDRFVLYPLILRRQVRWADAVHICDQANAVYVSHLQGRPHLVTCHDMLAMRAALGEIAESPTGWTGRIYQRWILRGLRSAQAIACVSQQTADELTRVAGISSERITLVPNALNHPYRPMLKEEAEDWLRGLKVSDARPFFVHVGGNQWYKNRLGVIRLFAELIKQSPFRAHYLVMAGKPWTEEMRALVVNVKLQGRVLERVEVSNAQLNALYATAEALLFPSLSEGFGWPIIEAQASGCPVMTSNRAPMTDVGGDAAIYIDPTAVEDGAAQVAAALAERDYWRQAGLINAQRFSVEAMVNSYIRCYDQVKKWGL